MTAHQRRPGFRLPWSSEGDAADAGSADADAQSAVAADIAADAAPQSADEMGEHAAAESASAAADADQAPDAQTHARPDPQSQTEDTPVTATSAPTEGSASTAEPSPASGFLGDLVSAMRRVADETRETTMTELRARAEEAIRGREARLEQRRNDLRISADADIARVGEWAKAEAERIRAEAEQRVAARRAELDAQLAAEASRRELDPNAVNARVEAYEAELNAFYTQLGAIDDPAAFAAAAKRMPAPPSLEDDEPVAAAEPAPDEPAVEEQAEATGATEHSAGTNGAQPAEPVTDESGAAVSAANLEALAPAPAEAATETYSEPIATEIVVKGLGSFGAITGFRQQLAGVDGVDAVGLSLGTSGEFVFRATHRPSLDVSAAITALEGEGTDIEPRPEGGLRVTLARPR